MGTGLIRPLVFSKQATASGPILRKHKYFQWLTTNVGYPKLREHIGSVVTIMKLSTDWYDFRAKLDRLHPRYGKPTQLTMEFAEDEPDTGKGL